MKYPTAPQKAMNNNNAKMDSHLFWCLVIESPLLFIVAQTRKICNEHFKNFQLTCRIKDNMVH